MTSETKAKVLFLDDDKFIVDLYGSKFAHAGYEVQTAMSAEDALTKLRGGFLPDVIICDLVMTKLSGFDFLSTVRLERLAPDAYVIVLTNQAEELDKVQAEQLGADRYIVKITMVPEEVVATVDQVVAHRRSADK